MTLKICHIYLLKTSKPLGVGTSKPMDAVDDADYVYVLNFLGFGIAIELDDNVLHGDAV
jgi:hypothetical protein